MALKGEKNYRSFVKGLITEANELTYPEGSSIDEDNFVLNRDGSRSRRLGIDFENLYQLNDTNFSDQALQEGLQSFHLWNSPAGDTTVSLGIVRIQTQLWFMDLLSENPSANLKNNNLPIDIPTMTGQLQTAIINNKCVLVCEGFDKPIALTYNPADGNITQDNIDIKIRDLYGVHDGYDVSERPPYQGAGNLTSWVANQENKLNKGDQFYNASNDGIYKIVDRFASYRSVQVGGGIYFQTIQQAYYKFGSTAPSHTSGTQLNGNYSISFVRYRTASGFTSNHRYNLKNQGWSDTIQVVGGGNAIDKTGTVLGVYPSNADVYSLGKNSNPSSGDYEKYDPNILKKNSQSKYQVAQGSYVIDAFNRGTSRSTESNVSNLPLDQEQGNMTTVCSYAQRLFYSGINSNVNDGDQRSPNYSGYIFFTKVVRSDEDLGKCYQEADPTDPGINDLIASDGGTIQIPEITRIIKLEGSQSSLLVFAENGVWEVYGDTGGFFANSFQVSKVSTNGVLDPNSIVNVNGNFLYWSKAGIYSLTTDNASGRYRAENISLKTIQTLFLSIPSLGRKYCKGFYDEKENRVRWLYNDTATYSETNYRNRYNKELIYDLTLQAFYTHTISDLETNSPWVSDYVEIPNFVSGTQDTNVVVGADNVITSTDDVIVTIETEGDRNTQFSFLTFKEDYFTLSKYQNTSFKDWVTANAVGTNYSSYLVTGYELFGDLLKYKQAPYIFFYFKRTEDGFTDASGTLELTNQSSCKVQAQWNWANSANSGKWGSEFQAYRITKNYIPSGTNDPFDSGDSVVVTKNKLRGSGKTLSLKIQSEEGKDMQILGFGMPVTMTQIH